MAEMVLLDSVREHPLDDLKTTCFVLPFFSDERPVKGLTGYADWRMNGKISRDLLAQRVAGDLQEVVLIPSAHRLKAENLLLLGLGPQKSFSKVQFFQALLRLVGVLRKSKPAHFAIGLHSQISLTEQCEWLAEFLRQDESLREPWTVFSHDSQTENCLQAVQRKFPDFKVSVAPLMAGAVSPKKPFTLR